jgi:hypothetical protein
LLREIWPDATVPLQLFVPLYDPVIVVVVADASPDTFAVHAAYGASKPPAAIAIVK